MQIIKTRSYLVVIFITMILCLSTAPNTQAGIFSGLSKLGKVGKATKASKAANHLDMMQFRKAELPDGYKNLTSTDLIPNPSGSWDVRLPNGKRLPLDMMAAQGLDLSRHALVIRSIDIPNELSYFKSIPPELPIFISNRSFRTFELVRTNTTSIKYGNISIPVNQTTSIKTALYNLEKPLFNSAKRFINLSEKASDTLPVKLHNSRFFVEQVNSSTLLGSLEKIKGQSIVLAGRVVDGKIYARGAKSKGASIVELKSIAAKNDLNLIILESNKPHALLKNMVKKMDVDAHNSLRLVYNNTTGDFFNLVSGGKSGLPLEVSFSKSGKSQIALHLQTKTKNVSTTVKPTVGKTSTADLDADTTDMFHLFTHSIRIFRASQHLEQEKERNAVLEKVKQEAQTKSAVSGKTQAIDTSKATHNFPPFLYILLTIIFLSFAYLVFGTLLLIKRFIFK